MYLGGPTGLGISEDDGNYPIYHQLSREKYVVTNTLKVIKK